MEFPPKGVTGFKIYTEDLLGNRSKTIVTGALRTQDNMDGIIFEKEGLIDGIRFSEIPTSDNTTFGAKYITDPLTGKTIMEEGTLGVGE
jgi:hypothetical protein